MMIPAINQAQNNVNFGSVRKPKSFGEMMNYIYRKGFSRYRKAFENKDTIMLTTKVDGQDVTGVVNFSNGKYRGLSLLLPFAKIKDLKEKFMKSALNNYCNNMPKHKRARAYHLKPAKRLNQSQIMKDAYD